MTDHSTLTFLSWRKPLLAAPQGVSSILFFILVAAVLVGCGPEADDEPDPEPATGIYATMGEPLPSASDEQLETFERGRDVMLKRFSREEGLGPKYNVSFCGSCHEKPAFGGSAPRYRNFLLVHSEQSDGSVLPVGVNGVQPQFKVDGTREQTDPDGNHLATRNAIPFFGVGLLAELSEESILANVDENDEDGDGISGRPNYDTGFVGRFGRKAQTVSIEGFIRGPLFNHLGITSNPLPNSLKAQLPVPSALPNDGTRSMNVGGQFVTIKLGQAAAPDEPTIDDDGVPDPELSEQELFDLVSFSMLLAAPEPDPLTPETEAGLELFREANCSGCHVESLEGPRGLVFAYTDLLLHDMGPELADGVSMGVATGNEFRTQPLWGVGATGPYMHDGRADTLEEAISWHGGEAEQSRLAFEAMTEEQKGQLIAFLESLGGMDQRSAGLIPPDEPPPTMQEPGGPLPGTDMARFESGRRMFDKDIPTHEGLGPRFNGDSCRACHFDPVVGGSGPVDLNVTRHGIVENGMFRAPEMGTMAHRHLVQNDQRAPVDETANVFEFRQTPPIFGLGLLDQVPDDTLLAMEDPTDENGDGISGRAHVLPDGRIGKLGWKANVPSVHEFARDALSNEVGLSLPERPGQTFGFTEDADAWPDPEISDKDYDDLIFYMERLAPLPPNSVDPQLEAAGEQVFMELGCDGCHMPTLTLEDGTDIHPYTDLLLHDVAEPDALGIADGQATMHEFRTPPLWGVGRTGPWMHDGLSFTLEQAILNHFGEASNSRQAYEALSQGDKDALRAFLESL